MVRALLLLALLAPTPSRAADGAEIYRRRCAGCHGADGGGGPRKLKDLASPEVQGKGDQELFDAVARGTPDRKMAGFRGRLADAEIKAAVEHLRTLKR
ncbi:MAG: c-type cytochrome [Deltaproteobacteria bacterium]|nr:c-type cytochrome [Deltaproteobacteria bacterium]